MDGEVDAGDAAAEAAYLSSLEAREKAVDAHLRAGRSGDAVKAALENPPFPSKVAATKERSAAAALRAIAALAAREADAVALVDALDGDAADVLMKVRERAGGASLGRSSATLRQSATFHPRSSSTSSASSPPAVRLQGSLAAGEQRRAAEAARAAR